MNSCFIIAWLLSVKAWWLPDRYVQNLMVPRIAVAAWRNPYPEPLADACEMPLWSIAWYDFFWQPFVRSSWPRSSRYVHSHCWPALSFLYAIGEKDYRTQFGFSVQRETHPLFAVCTVWAMSKQALLSKNIPYTLSLTRPFARRARITALPPRVFMRARNPCVRFLLITDGW